MIAGRPNGSQHIYSYVRPVESQNGFLKGLLVPPSHGDSYCIVFVQDHDGPRNNPILELSRIISWGGGGGGIQ